MWPPLSYTQCATSELSTEVQHLSRPQHLARISSVSWKRANASLRVLTQFIPSITGYGLGSDHSFSWTEACSFCLATVPWHILTEEVLSYVQEASSKPCDTGPVARGCYVSEKLAYLPALCSSPPQLFMCMNVTHLSPSKQLQMSLLQPRVHGNQLSCHYIRHPGGHVTLVLCI